MASSLSICLADDSADFQLLVQTIFEQCLPEVSLLMFDDGKALFDQLSHIAAKPNLIILDQHMPLLDSYQTLLLFKGDRVLNVIPIVMMSADASHSEMSRAYDAGAQSFVKKPTDFGLLKDELLTACQYASAAG